jgi:hypothetical protein
MKTIGDREGYTAAKRRTNLYYFNTDNNKTHNIDPRLLALKLEIYVKTLKANH